MSTKVILFWLVSACGSLATSSAQSQPFEGVRSLTKVSFLSPGLSYELKIGQFQTLYARAYLHPSGYFSASSTFGTNSKLYLDPALSLQYRYYYNAYSRGKKGRRTDMNNLNYLGPVYKVTFQAEQTGRSIHKVGAVWGLQRNYRSRFSLDINVGLGYQFAKETAKDGQIVNERVSEFAGVGQVSLGFWLNKRT